jgi:hypothetical protein
MICVLESTFNILNFKTSHLFSCWVLQKARELPHISDELVYSRQCCSFVHVNAVAKQCSLDHSFCSFSKYVKLRNESVKKKSLGDGHSCYIRDVLAV